MHHLLIRLWVEVGGRVTRVEHRSIVVVKGDVDVEDDHGLVQLDEGLRYVVLDALFLGV